MDEASTPLVYRKKKVLELFGVSETTLRRWMDGEGFPRPVQLGPRAVGWPAAACRKWLETRPMAHSNADDGDD